MICPRDCIKEKKREKKSMTAWKNLEAYMSQKWSNNPIDFKGQLFFFFI